MENELKFIQEVAKGVHNKGGRIYFVGGYVRDKFLKKENKDIDVEIYGLTMTQLKDLLRGFGEVMEVGASFGILMVKGYDIDFALPRTENSTGSKHTDFDVTVNSKLSLSEATKRRDFTMNAILQDVLTGDYIDLYGGIADINAKRIRYVDKDTFKEDELRIFRACQFASRFGFTIDDSVKEVAKDFNYQSLSKERIYEELNKALLKSDKPSIAFNEMFDMGVIEKLFPELYALKGCTQSKEHHPEGDVWNHTMMVVDECARLREESTFPLGLMYAGLCHDLGKPSTREETEDGKIRFFTHDEVGAKVAERFLSRLTNDKKLISYVMVITEYHMKAHRLLDSKDSTLRKMFTQVDMHELILMTEADDMGRGKKEGVVHKSKRKDHEKRIEELSMGGFGKIVPFFKGADLIKMGYVPGVQLGKTLEEAYQSQLNGDSKDKIKAMLENKINPKPKPRTTGVIVDEELSLFIKNDKSALEKSIKRLTFFKYHESNQSKGGINFKRSENKIPYVEVIAEDRKSKYLITPMYVLALSLNNEHKKVLFTTFDNKIDERQAVFTKVLGTIQARQSEKLNFLTSVYGRLPNKN